jgi:uncharacterized protein involved in outer membrane biogenesis
MTRILKITGIAFGAVVALVILLLAVLLLAINPNDYKPEIAALVKKKTDMDLVIADKLEWTFWPRIGVKLGKTSLSDTQAKETLVAVDLASVSVELMPLLTKSIQIDAVNLDGAKVRFIQHADGTTSWDRMLAKLASAPKDDSKTVAFNIKKLDIKNTAILIKDEKNNTERAIEEVAVTASDIGMDKDFPLHLAFTFRQQQAAANLLAKTSVDTRIKIDQDKKQYALNDLDITSALSGSLLPTTAPATVSLKGNVLADMQAQKITVSKLDIASTYPAHGLSAPATVQLNTEVAADLGKTLLTVSGLKMNASWPDATRPQPITAVLNTALSANWADGALDITALTLNATVPDKAYPKPLQVAFNGALKANWMKGDFSIPAFVLDAAGVRTNGAITAALPALQHKTPAATTTPGTTPIAIPMTTGMTMTGKVDTAAFNPRNVMAALGMAAPKMADATVLKSASFAADIQGNEQQVLLKNIRLKLDDSTLTGDAGISDLASLRQYARLSLDKMDADRYLPPATPATASTTAATNEKTTASAAPASSGILPIALLKTQNLDAALTAGSLKIMQYPISGFRVAATASKGIVNISELKGGIFSGGFSVPVNINVQGAQPVLKMQPKLDHMEIEPLATKILKKNLLSGKTSYVGDLTLHGNTTDAWMKSASGMSNLTLENGVLHGVNAMKELTASLGKYQGLLALTGKDADTLANKQKDTEIASFAANNTLANGVVTTTSLTTDLKKAKLAGTGVLNLVTQDLDYKFSMTLDKSVGGEKTAGYALPVQCKGNLAGNMASLCQLDSKALAGVAAKAAAMKGLEKLGIKGLDGKTPDAAVKDKAAEETQKAKEKLNDKLSEGLNKLFKH